MLNLKDLIYQLRLNPNLVGTKSVSCLRAFFDGWSFRKKPSIEDAYLDYLFQPWIEKKFGIGDSYSQSWTRILSLVNHDEYDAFFHFFELFDIFYEEAKNASYEEIPYSGIEYYDHHSVEDLLTKLQTRTVMYIGENTFSHFNSFLRGWFLRDPDGITDWYIMEGFEKWIVARYKHFPGTASWDKIIQYYSANSCNTLMQFFEQYNEYIQTLNR